MASILIVDDEKLIANSLQRVMQKGGHKTTVFNGGIEAVQWIQEAAKVNSVDQPQLAIVDLLMPEIGGGEVLDCIQSLIPSCKVIVMTAYGDLSVKEDLKRRGARLVISKPFENIFSVLDTVEKEINS